MLLTLIACGQAGLQDVDPPPDKPHALDTDEPDEPDDTEVAESVPPEDTSVAVDTAQEPEDTGEPVDTSPPPDPRRMWLLPQTDKVWTEHELDSSASPHAPIDPIEAAFGMPDLDRLWVLTGATFHVMRTDTWAWIDSGDRDAMFPEIAGQTLNSAETVPAYWGTTTIANIYAQVDEVAWVYDYDVESGDITLNTSVTLDTEWSGELGPAPARITAAWLAVDETAGWAPGDPNLSCDADAERLGPYMVALTSLGMAHTWDAGYCMDFVDERAADLFSVFTYAGAPDPDAVVAIDWTGTTLVAFTE